MARASNLNNVLQTETSDTQWSFSLTSYEPQIPTQDFDPFSSWKPLHENGPFLENFKPLRRLSESNIHEKKYKVSRKHAPWSQRWDRQEVSGAKCPSGPQLWLGFPQIWGALQNEVWRFWLIRSGVQSCESVYSWKLQGKMLSCLTTLGPLKGTAGQLRENLIKREETWQV